MNPQELENRLVNFSLQTTELCEHILRNEQGNHLLKQLARSGTSVSLNYGETRAAESSKDFVHKMKIVLKELRETHICLRLIKGAGLFSGIVSELAQAISENNELIAIFVCSVATAQGSPHRAEPKNPKSKIKKSKILKNQKSSIQNKSKIK